MNKIKYWVIVIVLTASTLGFLPEAITNPLLSILISPAEASPALPFSTDIRYCACNAAIEPPAVALGGVSQAPRLSFESLYSDRLRYEGYYVFHCVCRAKPGVGVT